MRVKKVNDWGVTGTDLAREAFHDRRQAEERTGKASLSLSMWI